MEYSEKYIGKIVTVKMDRQLGSKHPKWGFLYLLNYGFVPGTLAPDGEELDAYVLGVYEPREEFTGRVIAVVERQNQSDDKLIVVEDGKSFTDDQIKALTDFQENYSVYNTKIKR